MNLFACEDNVLKWSQADPESGEGIRPLGDWATMFSCDLFRRRLDADYLEKLADYRKQIVSTMLALGMTGPWFMRPRD